MSTDIKMDTEELTEALNNKVDIDALKQYLPTEGGTMTGAITTTVNGVIIGRKYDDYTHNTSGPSANRTFVMGTMDSGDYPLGSLQVELKTTEEVVTRLRAHNVAENQNRCHDLDIHCPKSGNAYATCPTYPTYTDSSNKIATTQWVHKWAETNIVAELKKLTETDQASYTFPSGGTYTGVVTFRKWQNGVFISTWVSAYNKIAGGTVVGPANDNAITDTNAKTGWSDVYVLRVKVKQ